MEEQQPKPFVVGLDLGGTNSVFGIVNQRGEILATSSIKTQAYKNVDDFVKAGVECLLPIIEEVGGIKQIKAMGIGAPNANYYKGTVEYAPNLSWAHETVVPLAQMFSDKLGIPVGITNDANAAAIGEMQYGAARGMKNFVMLTLGTGVGSGIVINGQLVYGCDGFAGELGHVTMVRENGRTCGCGRTGCLEAYCSATGVARTAREWLDNTDEPSLLRKLDKISAKDVNDAARQGDELSIRIFNYTGTLLGQSLADFVNFSAPEAIVLFGGLARNKEFLTEPILRAMNENLLPLWKNKVKLVYTSLKESDAAILGASALAW